VVFKPPPDLSPVLSIRPSTEIMQSPMQDETKLVVITGKVQIVASHRLP
jgi:hypothetical protein